VWDQLRRRLEGDLVVLEPLGPQHEHDLFQASRDPDVWRWYLGSVPSRNRFGDWFQQALDDAASGHAMPFATLERRSGRAIGTTRYMALRSEHRGLEIGGTWLTPAAWRTGVNIEAKLLMLDHAFGRLECLRVEFKADARNARSRAALAALPAEFEGILRRHMIVPFGNGVRDSAYYSVISEDWPAVRANLIRRLRARTQSNACAKPAVAGDFSQGP
jgi:N-acetyltransferase